MAQLTGTDPKMRRTANLALIFQEVLTAIVRLRWNRESITDAESFRQHLSGALRTAAQEARDKAAYPTEDIKTATFAIVGFLDETVLGTRSPVFSDWPGKPLQEELFGTHTAGEVFFQNLENLMARNDSPELADLLEVHYLCLLLGFRGRYSGRSGGEVEAVMNAVAGKIRRIRGGFDGFSPAWALPQESLAPAKDFWTRRLFYATLGCLLLTALLFVIYKLLLVSGVPVAGGGYGA
jgi:type VI secretion system protein ImpK